MDIDQDWPEELLLHQGRDANQKFHPNNLFIKHLPSSFGDNELRELFSRFGEIVSAHVTVDPLTGKGKGYGFVYFTNQSSAKEATLEMHGKQIPPNKILHVEPSLAITQNPRNTKPNAAIYVKHIPVEVTEEELKTRFSSYGTIVECKLFANSLTGLPNGISLIKFSTNEQAAAAKQAEHGKKITSDSLPLLVRFAEPIQPVKRKSRKDPRQQPSKTLVKSSFYPAQTNQLNKSRETKFVDKVDGGINLFVFHIPDAWTDSHLEKIFTPFGTITSAKVMMHLFGDNAGKSKGFGFVKFRDATAGFAAMASLNGSKAGKKKLLITTKKSE
eukprot:c3470_g1_i1.p1 GENE.c3470_g1_i1~~c3470_g1_i1.p1  ORF type:complete len:358 (-),score=76.27 c3470_g1_i1:295-1281(-)